MIPICVPYRGDGGHRDQSWAFVREWWTSLEIGPVITGDVDGPFNRAAARNAAAHIAGSWDVAIFGDADTFMPDPAPIRRAIEGVDGRVVLPHDRYAALTSYGTRQLLRGRRWQRHVKYEREDVPLGIVVVSRQAWETVGGFDERFTSWGGEDVAFRSASTTLSAVARIPGTLVHLWHPRDPGKAKYIAERGGPLRQEYRSAEGDPIAMRKLLEGKT